MAAANLFAQGVWYQPDTRVGSTTPGQPLVGAQLTAFITGTSTPAILYRDSDLSSQWSQPIVTNASGQSDDPIYVDTTPSLKIVITDEDDVNLPGFPMDPWAPYALA